MKLHAVNLSFTDSIFVYFFFVLRSESPSSASMNIPMLSQMPGMMSNSLDDEDDDYDS